MNLLARIIEDKRRSLEALSELRLPEPPSLRPLGLRRDKGSCLNIIAEIKHRSPSAGTLSTALSVPARARAYERGGAAMVSVLCDEQYFGGHYEHMEQARSACDLPILCKEFVLDPLQLDVARAYGADVVLLIARIAERPGQLRALLEHARGLGLMALVEVTSHDEARHALDAGAEVVGVNARDLDTLQMDVPRAARVLASLPPWVTSVHLSGLASSTDVARVAASAAHAALIGEALMRAERPEHTLRSLCECCA